MKRKDRKKQYDGVEWRKKCKCTDYENMEDHGLVAGGVNEGKRILICTKCKEVRIV